MSFNISAILHVVFGVDSSDDLTKLANWIKIQLQCFQFGEGICIGRVVQQLKCVVYNSRFAVQCLMSCFTCLDLFFYVRCLNLTMSCTVDGFQVGMK